MADDVIIAYDQLFITMKKHRQDCAKEEKIAFSSNMFGATKCDGAITR